MTLGMGISQDEENKAGGEVSKEEEGNCIVKEAAGEGEESGEGESAVNVEPILYYESADAS